MAFVRAIILQNSYIFRRHLCSFKCCRVRNFSLKTLRNQDSKHFSSQRNFHTSFLNMVKEGEAAPDFSLKDQDGNNVRLSDFKGKKAVILYFYPKDDTPGCTKQALCFREAIEDFAQLGAEVIGVSSDQDHRKFVEKYKLPFKLLSDEGSKVRKLYEVPSTFGILPGRVTYVIDRQGIVKKIYNNQFRSELHVEEAKKALKAGGN
ncbi:peroxiredoxin Q/BCP [Galdieria sulphuraria]|uniref:thioredoxin-dependent peroxiredoxin n=1 Tax=Galdieria sulphuraria TaxID=130081 RepID=M2X6X8_GALSU|nr:peroxiredoxin Q/BCP [Galdieria sulphuraria]EME32265.1 peroxiredoxin Q/BCP [Galdieria sulphuraria]|eukprot:XP_005708785.1 peroxiredoxin Q/BCP [Galdieria sulphuraria]